MGEDATLEDFLEVGAASTSEDREPEAAEAAVIDPARTTYAFDPDGAVCATCDAKTDRRWRQEGDLVCAACKEW